MENLPTISQMYSVIREQSDYGALRWYAQRKQQKPTSKLITKKGSFLDDELKLKNSPGPANKSNIQPNWAKKRSISPKYSDRKTYISEIEHKGKKYNWPSSSSYKLEMPWPVKNIKDHIEAEKTNFINTSEYKSQKTPGPGTYLIATTIGNRKIKPFKFVQNRPKQDVAQPRPNMTTYDPVQYGTFKRIEKMPKLKNKSQTKIEIRKAQKQNKHPGPGQYQIINTWIGKQQLKKGQSAYFGKIYKKSMQTIYYN